jgi:hypothetical protein
MCGGESRTLVIADGHANDAPSTNFGLVYSRLCITYTFSLLTMNLSMLAIRTTYEEDSLSTMKERLVQPEERHGTLCTMRHIAPKTMHEEEKNNPSIAVRRKRS